jgi:hypothetical protein
MKHIGQVSVVPNGSTLRRELSRADAFTDLWNGLWRVWSDFIYQKKNEISV